MSLFPEHHIYQEPVDDNSFFKRISWGNLLISLLMFYGINILLNFTSNFNADIRSAELDHQRALVENQLDMAIVSSDSVMIDFREASEVAPNYWIENAKLVENELGQKRLFVKVAMKDITQYTDSLSFESQSLQHQKRSLFSLSFIQ